MMQLFLILGLLVWNPTSLRIEDDLFARAEQALDAGQFDLAHQLMAELSQTAANPLRESQLAYLKGSEAFLQNQLDTAFQALSEAKRVSEPLNQPEFQANISHRLGYVALALGKFDQAKSELVMALSLKENAKSSPHSKVKTLHALADCEQKLGNADGALLFWQKAVSVLEAAKSPALDVAFERGYYLKALSEAGKLEAAKLQSAKIREAFSANDPTSDLRYLGFLHQIAVYELKNENYMAAFEWLDKAQALEETKFGANDARRLQTLLQQCDLAHLMEESWRGEKLYRDVIEGLKQQGDTNRVEMPRAYFGLGVIYVEWNNIDDARKMFELAARYEAQFKNQVPALFEGINKSLANLKPQN